MISTLTKFDQEKKTIGSFMLCCLEKREWAQIEINLFKAIVESIIDILFEIIKLIEISELRNTFIITLAHDIQVPLVGYKKALEFLASREKNELMGKYTYFINDAIESNNNLLNLLTRLLESYYYESGKKQLNLIKQNVAFGVMEVIDSLRDLAITNSITLNTEIPEIFRSKYR